MSAMAPTTEVAGVVDSSVEAEVLDALEFDEQCEICKIDPVQIRAHVAGLCLFCRGAIMLLCHFHQDDVERFYSEKTSGVHCNGCGAHTQHFSELVRFVPIRPGA